MRLNPKKIESLAKVIHKSLGANPEIELTESADKITHLIRQVIAEDMKIEDEIEEEARQMLEPLMSEIQRKGASYDQLLRKTKQKLAQDRKFKL